MACRSWWALVVVAALAGLSCRPEYTLQGPGHDASEVLPCAFEPVEGEPALEAYACNPVFTLGDEPWALELVSVDLRVDQVLGAPIYELFYSARTLSGWGLGYAVSVDGVSWVPHEDNPVHTPAPAGWDRDGMDQLAVLFDEPEGRLLLAYQGYELDTPRFGMGLLSSVDGAAWAPVGATEPWVDLSRRIDGVDYCWPLFLQRSPGGYAGWMAGSMQGAISCSAFAFEVADLSRGVDLADPTAQPERMLAAGPEPYDLGGVSSAAVVEHRGVSYLLYVGIEAWDDAPGGITVSRGHTLSVAISVDGRRWKKLPGNPLTLPGLEQGQVAGVAAALVGDRIQVWVVDHYDGASGLAVGTFLLDPSALIGG